MGDKHRLTIRIDSSLTKRLDTYSEKSGVGDRSTAIRLLLDDALSRWENQCQTNDATPSLDRQTIDAIREVVGKEVHDSMTRTLTIWTLHLPREDEEEAEPRRTKRARQTNDARKKTVRQMTPPPSMPPVTSHEIRLWFDGEDLNPHHMGKDKTNSIGRGTWRKWTLDPSHKEHCEPGEKHQAELQKLVPAKYRSR